MSAEICTEAYKGQRYTQAIHQAFGIVPGEFDKHSKKTQHPTWKPEAVKLLLEGQHLRKVDDCRIRPTCPDDVQ